MVRFYGAFASGEKGIVKKGKEEALSESGKKFKVESGCQPFSYNRMGTTVCRLFEISGP